MIRTGIIILLIIIPTRTPTHSPTLLHPPLPLFHAFPMQLPHSHRMEAYSNSDLSYPTLQMEGGRDIWLVRLFSPI